MGKLIYFFLTSSPSIKQICLMSSKTTWVSPMCNVCKSCVIGDVYICCVVGVRYTHQSFKSFLVLKKLKIQIRIVPTTKQINIFFVQANCMIRYAEAILWYFLTSNFASFNNDLDFYKCQISCFKIRRVVAKFPEYILN